MSKYKKISVDFKNPDSILKTLRDLGFEPEVSKNLRSNDVVLETHWLSHGSTDQKVAIALQRDAIRDSKWGRSGSSFDGVGFQWNGSSYDMIYDQTDEYFNEDLFDKIKQGYAINEGTYQAKLHGYSVQEVHMDDGTVQLVCSGIGSY